MWRWWSRCSVDGTETGSLGGLEVANLHPAMDYFGTAPERTRKELSKDGRAEALRRFFASGAKFEVWKSDPFLALIMYVQIQEAFGWDAFRKVFAEYRQLSPNERPKNDDEKRDQWLIRLSRTVGRNLARFFDTWGIPVSEQAKQAVADLPEWMPENFPPK